MLPSSFIKTCCDILSRNGLAWLLCFQEGSQVFLCVLWRRAPAEADWHLLHVQEGVIRGVCVCVNFPFGC